MPLLKGVRHDLVGGHDGPMSAHLGVVLHVNDSNGNLDNWVANHGNNMSCHVEVYKNGSATQYVDLAFASWCQMSGNSTYLSIETEGYPTEALTEAQCHRIADVYAQCHVLYGIPLNLAERVGQRGFGTHAMGGDGWGGHTGCPGDKRKAQRSHILALAAAILEPKPKPPAVPSYPSSRALAGGLVSRNSKYQLLVGDGGGLQIHHAGSKHVRYL